MNEQLEHENEFVEYKDWNLANMKTDSPKFDELKNTIKKTICAFANTQGGIIYFGVNDDRKVKGISNYENPGDKINIFVSNLLTEIYPPLDNTHEMRQIKIYNNYGFLTDLSVVAVIIYPNTRDKAFVSSDLKYVNLIKRGQGTNLPIQPHELEGRIKDIVKDALDYQRSLFENEFLSLKGQLEEKDNKIKELTTKRKKLKLQICSECKEHKVKAKNLCTKCYYKNSKKNRKSSNCHPEKIAYCKGLCRQCYNKKVK